MISGVTRNSAVAPIAIPATSAVCGTGIGTSQFFTALLTGMSVIEPHQWLAHIGEPPSHKPCGDPRTDATAATASGLDLPYAAAVPMSMQGVTDRATRLLELAQQ